MLSGKGISENDVLLFYKEFEVDKFVRGDRYLKRVVRPFWNMVHSRQKKTGFKVSFENLCQSLRLAGFNVRVNEYAVARRNPRHPVGAVGFPTVLDNWDLENPALLGPSLYDHPGLAPTLFDDKRFRKYLVLADWMLDLFTPTYGDRCVQWFAGIDLAQWPDRSADPKSIDFLIYDKIRWDHECLERELLEPIRRHVSEHGYKAHDIRYAFHDHATFKELLARSRAMIFVCEHETQGLAYQEAMASGVPVLAWDRGFWADPLWKRFSDSAPPASSVPFFAPDCGERFRSIEEFPAAFDRFLANLPNYDPREYVRQNLSQERSARIYADTYFSLAGG